MQFIVNLKLEDLPKFLAGEAVFAHPNNMQEMMVGYSLVVDLDELEMQTETTFLGGERLKVRLKNR